MGPGARSLYPVVAVSAFGRGLLDLGVDVDLAAGVEATLGVLGEARGGRYVTRLPPFERHRPASVEEATELLEHYGDDAIAYVGGTEVFLLKLGFADYAHVIDLKAIDELRGIERRDGVLRIGAAETHRAIERHETVRADWPALAEMERAVGNLRVRTMGSIGGNLCFADPHPTRNLPARARRWARGSPRRRRATPNRDRRVRKRAVRERARSRRAADRGAGPEPTPGRRSSTASSSSTSARRSPSPAICGATATGSPTCGSRSARRVCARRGRRRRGAPRRRLGRRTRRRARAAGALVADAAEPVEDANGSVEYKRHLVGVLTGRAVERRSLRQSSAAAGPNAVADLGAWPRVSDPELPPARRTGSRPPARRCTRRTPCRR